MTDRQNELLKQLFKVVTDLSEECQQDENFNDKLSGIIQDHEITNYSLDDIAIVIGKFIK